MVLEDVAVIHPAARSAVRHPGDEHGAHRLDAGRPTGQLDVSLPHPRAPCGGDDGALRRRALTLIGKLEIDMNALDTHGEYSWPRRAVTAAVLTAVAVLAARDAYASGKHNIEPPAKSEFGLGPRAS